MKCGRGRVGYHRPESEQSRTKAGLADQSTYEEGFCRLTDACEVAICSAERATALLQSSAALLWHGANRTDSTTQVELQRSPCKARALLVEAVGLVTLEHRKVRCESGL